jgi:hypothetical protein
MNSELVRVSDFKERSGTQRMQLSYAVHMQVTRRSCVQVVQSSSVASPRDAPVTIATPAGSTGTRCMAPMETTGAFALRSSHARGEGEFYSSTRVLGSACTRHSLAEPPRRGRFLKFGINAGFLFYFELVLQ